jgi:hypothetical protein
MDMQSMLRDERSCIRRPCLFFSICHTKENMKRGQLGAFEELVLLAVHGLGDDAYGVATRDVLERETGRSVSLGPVYTVRRSSLARRHAVAAAVACSRSPPLEVAR